MGDLVLGDAFHELDELELPVDPVLLLLELPEDVEGRGVVEVGGGGVVLVVVEVVVVVVVRVDVELLVTVGPDEVDPLVVVSSSGSPFPGGLVPLEVEEGGGLDILLPPN